MNSSSFLDLYAEDEAEALLKREKLFLFGFSWSAELVLLGSVCGWCGEFRAMSSGFNTGTDISESSENINGEWFAGLAPQLSALVRESMMMQVDVDL